MTYVWGFGAPKPVPGLQPQVVAADEDAEGVREIPMQICVSHQPLIHVEACCNALELSPTLRAHSQSSNFQSVCVPETYSRLA